MHLAPSTNGSGNAPQLKRVSATPSGGNSGAQGAMPLAICQHQQNQDEKLDQNEELAKLRADTSIEKTILSKTIPSADSMMKNTENMVPNVEIMRKG